MEICFNNLFTRQKHITCATTGNTHYESAVNVKQKEKAEEADEQANQFMQYMTATVDAQHDQINQMTEANTKQAEMQSKMMLQMAELIKDMSTGVDKEKETAAAPKIDRNKHKCKNYDRMVLHKEKNRPGLENAHKR